MTPTNMADDGGGYLFRRLIDEGFNEGRLDVVDEVVAVDFVEHQFEATPLPPGREAVKELITRVRGGAPDFHLAIEELATVGDRVWARLTATYSLGGRSGEAATRRVAFTVLDEVRVADDRIAEHWGVPDRFASLVLRGLWPPPRRDGSR